MIEQYKNFIIKKATYREDYGAWLSSCDYAYYHKDMEDDPEGLSFTYGFGKTLDQCRKNIDDIIDLHDLNF